MSEFSREILLDRGVDLARRFCGENDLPMPTIHRHPVASWRFPVCAYYGHGPNIHVCVERCASIGTVGRSWSFPGYAVDRTPYGVIAHEIGHHADVARAAPGTRLGRYWSDYSGRCRRASGDEPLTGYCENDAEWFAEMFRLFVTNPDLLRLARARTYAVLVADGFKPIVAEPWDRILVGAPPRTLEAARRRIASADGDATQLALL